jgi:type III restriction enzyme
LCAAAIFGSELKGRKRDRVMSTSFYEKPILNSPYKEPNLHHALDTEGQPTDNPPINGRRKSELITPVPKPRKRKKQRDTTQTKMNLHADDGISSEEQEYNPTPIINDIRSHVSELLPKI